LAGSISARTARSTASYSISIAASWTATWAASAPGPPCAATRVGAEWREALERSKKIVGRKFIVPVVVDADYQGNLQRYRSLVDEFPAFQALHFGRAPGGQQDEELRQTLVTEIRAMRREEAR
jgi:hypothetical protein